MCPELKELTEKQLTQIKKHSLYEEIANYPFTMVTISERENKLLDWFMAKFAKIGITINKATDVFSRTPYGSDYSVGYSVAPHEDFGYEDTMFMAYVLEAEQSFSFTTYKGKVKRDYLLEQGSLIMFDPSKLHWVDNIYPMREFKRIKPFVILVMPILKEDIRKLQPFIKVGGVNIDIDKLIHEGNET